MAFSDRLALLITADVDGAIKGLKKVGDTADKELGKAENRTDKWAGKMRTAGVGMVTFGAVAFAGLGKMAKASEEANLSVVKLDNTLGNMPKLAGENRQSFIDLADAIQDKTAADADQIVSAQAMLGTFRLTGDEIRNITPLVVDYARKFGTDLTTAAVQVGKALDGQVGALKRNGVSIDEALFKTDKYAAVQQALRDQVGGFAEQEGKTFAGSLERLKNNLGDLSEGVGAGAVEAFTDWSDAASGVVGRLNELDPAILKTTGKIAAITAATATGIGGLSVLGGQLLKMRERFVQLDPVTGKATGGLTKLGKAAAALGAVGGVIALGTALSTLGGHAKDLEGDLADLAETADEALIPAFLASGNVLSDVDGRFEALAQSSFKTAVRLRDAFADAGADVARFDEILKTTATGHRQAEQDAEGNAKAIEHYADETDDASESTHRLARKVGDGATAADRMKDAINGVSSALGSYLDEVAGMSDANIDLEQSFDDLTTTVHEHGKELDIESQIGRDNKRAMRDVAAGILEVGQAYFDQTHDAEGAKNKVEELTNRFRDHLAQLGFTKTEIQNIITEYGLIPSNIDTVISANGGQALTEIQKVQAAADRLQANLTAAGFVSLGEALNTAGTPPPRKSTGTGGGGIRAFDDGGVVPGPRGAPRLILAHAGETILPTHKTPAPVAAQTAGGLHVENLTIAVADAHDGPREARMQLETLALMLR